MLNYSRENHDVTKYSASPRRSCRTDGGYYPLKCLFKSLFRCEPSYRLASLIIMLLAVSIHPPMSYLHPALNFVNIK